MIYLAKVGDNSFEYEKVGEELNLLLLNRFIMKNNFPILNSGDMQMIRNSGGTIVCKTPNNEMVWLVNVEHHQDEKVGVILGEELVTIVRNIISRIKRDLTLNNIL